MKFRDCAARTLASPKVNQALEILHNLEKQPRIATLTSVVSGK